MTDLQELVHCIKVPDSGAISGYTELFYVRVSDAEKLLAEIKRLRAVIDQLPKTRDGVTITPGMTVFGRWRGAAKVKHIRNDGYVLITRPIAWFYRKPSELFCSNPSELFSSDEAAREAKP